MKRLITLSLFILFVAMASPLKADMPKSVTVLGAALVQKEEKQNAKQYLAEYIPEGENFDNFTKMFAVWGQLDGSDAESQVKAKMAFVQARKGKDPLANYSLFQSDDKKTFGLDFLISEGTVMEHNVWTFQNVKGGVLAYQYARRHYDGKSPQSAEAFIKEIPSVGGQVLKFFKESQLPRPQGY